MNKSLNDVQFLCETKDFASSLNKNCEVFQESGCVHVDGLLCKYPDCLILKKHKMKNKIAYVIVEDYGQYDYSWTNVYAVTLDKDMAQTLMTESIDSHKKIPESELPMSWEKFGELVDIYEENLEKYDWSDEKLRDSGWKFDDYTFEEFDFMEENYDSYFRDYYNCSIIVESKLY